MVYNAMKLFMEINPQLFDDCSHEYTEQQNNAAAREALRQRKWAAIEEQAARRRKQLEEEKKKRQGQQGDEQDQNQQEKREWVPGRAQVPSLPRVDEVDSVHEDNPPIRLDSLKLQDGDRKADRRPAPHDRQGSVGSSRSQR